MLELLLGIALAAGATYYVLLPILRPPPEPAADTGSSDEGEDPDDDMSPRAVAFRALKEIEFDRATGKLSDADYESLKAKYTSEALAAMRGETGYGMRDAGGVTPAHPASRIAHLARCGTALETDARYCNSCGARAADLADLQRIYAD